jgi:hypothetical protein
VQATVAEADIQRATISSIAVGHVGVGPIQVGQLILTNANFTVSAGQAYLSNVRIVIGIKIRLDWSVRIRIGFTFSRSGGITIGPFEFPEFGIGDVMVPGLNNIELSVPTVSVPGLTAPVTPLAGVQLGSATAEQIRATNLVVPVAGFSLAGLTLQTVEASALHVPGAGLSGASVGRIAGSPPPIGPVTIGGLGILSVSVPDITSQPFDMTSVPVTQPCPLDFGFLKITLKVTPYARARVDQLRISDAHASAAVGEIELRDVVVPYELLNLTLGQLGIETLQIPTIVAA